MPTLYRDARAFFAALAEMAEELRQAILELDDHGRLRLISRAVIESDMVFGVWPDQNEPEGFGVQIIKGEALMPPLVGFETDRELVVAAIPCASLEQAIVARDTWGDPKDAGEEPLIAEEPLDPISTIQRDGDPANGHSIDTEGVL